MCKKSYATPAPAPELLIFNNSLAEELNLSSLAKDQSKCIKIFTGRKILQGSQPIAQAYAGHQFGHFNPVLGDGRALLLGETVNTNGELKDIQLKGSGPTPFSRRGDGKSALGPVLREYLISESMHVLGIPTTRALAAISSRCQQRPLLQEERSRRCETVHDIWSRSRRLGACFCCQVPPRSRAAAVEEPRAGPRAAASAHA